MQYVCEYFSLKYVTWILKKLKKYLYLGTFEYFYIDKSIIKFINKNILFSLTLLVFIDRIITIKYSIKLYT